MTKYKNKLIAAGIILAILAVAWILGGNRSKLVIPPDTSTVATTSEQAVSPTPMSEWDEPSAYAPSATPNTTITPDSSAIPSPAKAETSSSGVEKGSEEYSVKQGMEINPSTGKDKYQTAPVPEGKPLPVEPNNASIGTTANTCILSVRCDTLVYNINRLDREKHELVPSNGVIFPAQSVAFYEGESVFNVLQREMRRAKIHMSFRNTPIYNSAYIEAINNLYEFDGGELSGWMYKVNGWFPNYGCSRYQLKPGDVVEWVYTCDLGRDVGGYYAAGE